MNQEPLVAAGTLATLATQHHVAWTKGCKIIQWSLSIQVSTFCCANKCQKQIKSTEAKCRFKRSELIVSNKKRDGCTVHIYLFLDFWIGQFLLSCPLASRKPALVGHWFAQVVLVVEHSLGWLSCTHATSVVCTQNGGKCLLFVSNHCNAPISALL